MRETNFRFTMIFSELLSFYKSFTLKFQGYKDLAFITKAKAEHMLTELRAYKRTMSLLHNDERRKGRLSLCGTG